MGLTDRLVLPLANESDAERTFDAISAALTPADLESIVVVHVIEKGGGAPDKAPVEARRDIGDEIFSVAEHRFGADVATDLRFHTDVVDGIIEATLDHDGTAIGFVPRPGGRLSRLLSGDVTTTLIAASPVPVISFPVPAAEE